ncbi:endolytic transglycosylase MltG [Actinoplanes philippinensis]|uniref:endolytic transglycosylase MltG n=1 Tax=Actinoplanes philippinensis TaxID=35752 RepID=UPI0033C3106F
MELRFEGNPDPGRWRHRRKEGKGRSVVAFVIVLLLLGGLGAGGWYGYDRFAGRFLAADYDGPGSGEVIVEVKKGDSASTIAETLHGAGVVKSTRAFVNAANENPKSTGIQVGQYKLRKEMKASEAVVALLDLKNKYVEGAVTIPEGWTKMQVFDELAKASGLKYEDFEKAASDISKLGVSAAWLKRTDGKKVDKANIEGFLYPATYELPKNATAEEILKLLVKNFNAEMKKLDFEAKAAKLKISPYEALVAASITQVEALLPEDMGPVARVLYNRAYSGDFPCGCLQLDSTVNYWLRLNGKEGKSSEKLTVDEMHSEDNPYRYNAPGMSIGPISNPGEVALTGAIEAPKSNFFFFVTIDAKGTMAYGKTFDEHNANIQIACKNGIPIC